MSKRPSLSNQPRQETHIGLRQNQILWTGVGIALSLAAILLVQDISYLGVNVSEVTAGPLTSQVRPGEQFRYELVVQRLDQGEHITLHCQLPEGLSFVPGSLQSTDSLPSWTPNAYGGERELWVYDVQGALEAYRITVGVAVEMKVSTTSQPLDIQTHYLWKGQRFAIEPHQQQTEIVVSLPQLDIQSRMTEGKWGKTNAMGCEILVRNPLDGIALDEWELPLQLVLELSESDWQIDPASVHIQGGWARPTTTVKGNQLSIDQLMLPQGELLNVQVQFLPAAQTTEAPPFVMGKATVFLPGKPYKSTALLRYREIPVEWQEGKVLMEREGPIIHWETLSELRTDRFEVEHSHNGSQFLAVGMVEKKRKPDQLQTYQYELPHLPLGEHIFRIKQVSVDGNVCHSPLIFWTNDNSQTPLLLASENLITQQGHLQVSVPYRQRIRLEVFNEMNERLQVLYNGTLLPDANFQVDLRASEWETGAYTFVLSTKQGTFSKTVLIGQEEIPMEQPI
ncbi:MAG: hypothetical protein AAF399_27480 [Bacteroidota bacterium]